MQIFKPLSLLVSAAFVFALLLPGMEASDLRAMHDSIEARYTRSHSLGDNYHFSARDGWQTVNVSNLQYKYRRDFADGDDQEDDPDAGDFDDEVEEDYSELAKRANKNAKGKTVKSAKKGSSSSSGKSSKKASSKKSSKTSKKTASKSSSKGFKGSSITSSVSKILASLKGEGKAEPVTITWYTGHDLENPSCWSNPTWAPTDASFACALTLDGWTTRPKCFKFLELCNTPKKCVFVRVIDSCAGCKKGSKHVDLTQAAFKELATLDEGLLQVQMRQATDPDGWLEHLWGPKN